MENNNQSKLGKWLEIMQQESWQLELIISGFAIFLVGSLGEPLDEWGTGLRISAQGYNNDVLMIFPFIILSGAWYFLLLNLIFHVILRGLWISTIGLRYVSGDIDWEMLNFHSKFENLLKEKIGSYDEFIEGLEKLCSVVFAFTFMIIFMLVSFGLWIIFIVLTVDFLIHEIIDRFLPEAVADPIGITIFFLLMLSGLLYFIDFLTLGWLKRKKWASKVYYPFYRFYSLITLGFLYRPIYYNLIDNKYGRTLSKLLVPYVVAVLVLSSLSVDFHPYFPTDSKDKNYLKAWLYDDIIKNPRQGIQQASIPSKFVGNGFLEVFINYNGKKSSTIVERICPDLTPLQETGLNSQIVIGFNSRKKEKLSTDEAMPCLAQLYKISIDDSLFQSPRYRFFRHPSHGALGFLTIMDVDYLSRGEHFLHIESQQLEEDSVVWKALEEIPFWKE